MRHVFSLLLPLLVVAAAPAPAPAQLTFAGIPWGTPADSAAARLQRADYPFRGTDQDGDRVFRGPDGADLVATMDSTGLVGVEVYWRHEPDQLPVRYALLADSLRAAHGPPDDEESEVQDFVTWSRGGEVLELFLRPRGAGLDSLLVLSHRAPGFDAEMDRRFEAERAEMEYERVHGPADTTAVGDWQIAYSDFRVLTRVDTVQFTRLGDRRYRARFLDQWMATRRLDNGLKYNAALTEVELDCRRMRTRLLRTVHLYALRAAAALDVPEAERRWYRPPRGSNDARAVAAACAALRRQRR